MQLREFTGRLARFPWATAARTLAERFTKDHIALTASSLTFTTTMALVPFFTVALAAFTAFPVFGKLEVALQAWLVQSLVPDSIARQVLGYLTQFSGKASRLGAAGLAVLFITALALVLTIDRTLNAIWRVKRPRPLGQRVLVYWAVMTLGPLLLAGSLSASSFLISASRGIVSSVPGALQLLFGVVEFALLTLGVAALYRYVPNTPVKRSHAWAGAAFAAVGIEVARRLLALYLGKVPTYSIIYGAFATFPILLVWIYLVWTIVLLGAVLAAYMPGLLAGERRLLDGPGWQFRLALDIINELASARLDPARGRSVEELLASLKVEVAQLEVALEALLEIDWIGRVNEVQDEDLARYVLLADPATTPAAALLNATVVADSPEAGRLWARGQLADARLQDLLAAPTA